mmetsp:Transcript_69674/g.153697  ORF Transcript_69674/g.153697 Transcript_69674/m.153697 type:complete len:212 (+) Transcript_69674:1675-2310(+)
MTPEAIQDLLHSKTAFQFRQRVVQSTFEILRFCLRQHMMPAHVTVLGIFWTIVIFANLLDEILDAGDLLRVHAIRDPIPLCQHVSWHVGRSLGMEGTLPNILILGKEMLTQRHRLVGLQNVKFLLIFDCHLQQGPLLVPLEVVAFSQFSDNVHVDHHVEALAMHCCRPKPWHWWKLSRFLALPLQLSEDVQKALSEKWRCQAPHLQDSHGH